jgi:acyl transferase domain-containing protein
MTPIAIVGRACVLPGALSPEQLWAAVVAGRDLTRSAPAGRWRVPGPVLCAADAPQADRCGSDRGGYVEGFEAIWNPLGFALPPEQLERLDPLVLWLLHCGREALSEVRVRPARVGAVIGNLGFPSEAMADFADRVWRGLPPGDPRNRAMSGGTAEVLAQALGLTAGSHCLDAACASSLYAIKLACDALADGDADLMLAGAVQRADDLFLHLGFCALGALSRSGQSRPFHREADGLLPAEGCALVALKRLDDARRDGDTACRDPWHRAVQRRPRQAACWCPTKPASAARCEAALADAGIDPAQVSLLECHATGTPVGDGTELRAPRRVYGARAGDRLAQIQPRPPDHRPPAHRRPDQGLEAHAPRRAAAQSRTSTRQLAALTGSPFRLLQQPEPWPAEAPRIAAISAFGFGGNNAHLILSADDAGIPAGGVTGHDSPIAIVAIGACMGNATDLRAAGAALFGEAAFDPRMEAIELDLAGLRFPPNDLKQALPQQLAMLRAAREALAAVRPAAAAQLGAGRDGAGCGDRALRHALAQRRYAAKDGVIAPLEAAGVLGCMPNIPANRLSSQFDCGGPSYTVQAGADSGLVALRIAARALAHWRDRCRAGRRGRPVRRAGHPRRRQCASGDAAVALVLRRLADAEREGQRVLGRWWVM